MSNESSEVQLARMDERLLLLIKDAEASKESRMAQYEAIEQLRQGIIKIDGRVANVEKQVASAQPTIEEFITIKHKVVGAGALGKWLWAAGAFLIGVAASSREAIFAWFKG